jgi:hypothetical protein
MRKDQAPRHFGEAVHICPCEFRLAGAAKAIKLRDQPTSGPCNVDPEIHQALRARHALALSQKPVASPRRPARSAGQSRSHLFTQSQLLESLGKYSPRLPVVIWTSGNCGDRILYWWVLSALRKTDLAPGRFWIAESVLGSFNYAPLAVQPTDDIRRAFHSMSALTKSRVRSVAPLWRKFASPSPRQLDTVRSHGNAAAPDVQVIEALYTWGVPAMSSDAKCRIMLSELDRSLLGSLRLGSWARPLDVLMAATVDPKIREILNTYGDNAVALRMNEWATWNHPAHLVRARVVRGGSDLLSGVQYQLTDFGIAVLKDGTEDAGVAPRFYIGGCEMYNRSRLWVRVHRARQPGWSIGRLTT